MLEGLSLCKIPKSFQSSLKKGQKRNFSFQSLKVLRAFKSQLKNFKVFEGKLKEGFKGLKGFKGLEGLKQGLKGLQKGSFVLAVLLRSACCFAHSFV